MGDDALDILFTADECDVPTAGVANEMLTLSVEMLNGDVTVLEVAKGTMTSSLDAVKDHISDRLGIQRQRQVYTLAAILPHDFVFEHSGGVLLSVVDAPFGWDKSCHDSVDNCVAFYTLLDAMTVRSTGGFDRSRLLLACRLSDGDVRECRHSQAHCMKAVPPMTCGDDEDDEGSFTISLTMTSVDILPDFEGAEGLSVCCGLVPESLRVFDSPLNSGYGGWVMDTADGSMFVNDGIRDPSFGCGAPLFGTPVAPGRVPPGAVLTMQANLGRGEHTLLFWVDGKRHGLGMRLPEACGPVQWAVHVPYKDTTVTIVDTPTLDAL